jgi:hypothetical protein
VSAPASYDLNAVVDALVDVFQDMPTGEELNGVPVATAAYGEVVGGLQVPALVFELDDLTWDLNMGGGADEFSIVGTLLVQTADARTAQRALRSALSRAPSATVGRIKARLETDPTLGGLVSYVHLSMARRIGLITYDQVEYLGAELVMECVS